MQSHPPADPRATQSFRKVLNPWKDEATFFLVNNLREMFKSADQVLLEFADKAQNNSIQTHFFEAMRELWLKQDNVVSIFQDGLERNIFTFRDLPSSTSAIDDALSLVDKDSFERNLALQTIANQAEKKYYSTLYELTQRLAILNGSRAVPMEKIPAGPRMLADIFEKCVEVIFIEKEVRLVLYTLFDRFVISKGIKIYEDLNQDLIAAGILPDLKPQFAKQSEPAKKPKPAPEHPPVSGIEVTEVDEESITAEDPYQETATSSEIAADTFDRIKDLLAHQRAQKMAAQKNRRRSSDKEDAAPVQVATRQDVITAIDDDSIAIDAPIPDVGVRQEAVKRVQVDAHLIVNINETLKKQRELIKKLVGKDRVPSEDEDVIDIVGLVFELMLNDKELCNEVKTLLSHLHTPYLKIAVSDASFLTEHEHPARRLFELMIATGRDLVDPTDLTKGIYPHIQRTVNTLLQNKQYEEQVFVKLAMELTEANAYLSDKQRISEERTVEVEKGRAKLNQAKDVAASKTRELMRHKILIQDAEQFLNGPWLDYLTLVLLRSDFNQEAESWLQAVSLGKKLIQFSLSSEDPNGGMPSSQAINDLSTEMKEIVGNLIPHYQAEIESFLDALGNTRKRDSSYIAPAVEDDKFTGQAHDTEVIEDQMNKLREVTSGTWFNLMNEEGEIIKVKMSWFNPVTANFLFVNQTGVKTAVKSIRQLAIEIIEEKAEILERSNIPFIDRSFQAIKSLLEKSIH
jgi:hypothetical protein